MHDDVRAAVESALGSAIDGHRRLGGGDINDAFEIRLADGRRLFMKTNSHREPRMFPTEARGLAWLSEVGAVRVPSVVAVSGSAGEGPDYLVLELIESAPRRPGFDEELGRGLAALHAAEPNRFGLDHDNFVGRLPQANEPAGDWPTFYRERRLEPLLVRAADRGLIDSRTRRDFDRLFDRLPERCGPPEPPARLHGDLWGGNLHVDDRGAPALIDPAVYGGHREIDLAMMRLFGGFGAACFDAYDEAFPCAPGHAERIDLYQLYPLLVHVNLFGGSYVGAVRSALSRYL